MINETFQILHLQERKISTSLFNQAKQAFIGQAYGHRFHSKYLVIESNKQLPDELFREGNICPVFIYRNKSYIFQEGESLHTYFLAKKDSDIVLCQQELWKLLSQITKALLTLRSHGYEHRHLKQYSIRRISSDSFKLIFHPTMNQAQQLIKDSKYSWFQFYLAPQQLGKPTKEEDNSCVFSLGALILNIMNPLDFKRDIYSRKEYKLNQNVLQEKMRNTSIIYSVKLIQVVKKMLEEDFEKRLSLQELMGLLNEVNPFEKKMHMTTSIRSMVSSKMTRNKQKSNSPPNSINKKNQKQKAKPKDPYQHRQIVFNRGTFGGQRQEDSDSLDEIEEIQQERRYQEQAIQEEERKEQAKRLKKNQSDYPSKSQTKPSQRSYSDYFTTKKKGIKQPSESGKVSEDDDTKAPSGKIKVSINIFNEEKTESLGDYNAYMNKINAKKPKQALQTSFQDKASSRQSSRCIEQESQEQISDQNISKVDKTLNYSNSLSSHGRFFEAGKEGIELQVNEFKERIKLYHIKITQCLQEPTSIAKRIGIPGVWINGNVYYGQFKNGRRNGLALQIFQNNEYYYGYFKDDMFHGEGFYFWNNNQHFLGLFQAGAKKEGTWCGRNKYVGQIKDNKRHGIGTYIYSNGRMYEGQWYMGKRHGAGIIIEPSGEKFIGTFKMGKKWGHGSYLVNGCRLNGVWDGEKPVGPCEIIYEDGRVYQGKINSDFEMHGEGELTFSTGSICKGSFQKDNFVFGQMIYKNGEHYRGQVRDMRRNGKGTYTYLGGRQVTGIWVDNKISENRQG